MTRSLDRIFGLDEEAIARPNVGGSGRVAHGKPVPVIVTIELAFCSVR